MASNTDNSVNVEVVGVEETSELELIEICGACHESGGALRNIGDEEMVRLRDSAITEAENGNVGLAEIAQCL